MEEFLQKLNEVFENHKDEADPNGNLVYIDDDYCYECNVWLIADGGSCNWSNIREVEKNGYKVYAGEKDSFGWLTGCIEAKNGLVLVYG